MAKKAIATASTDDPPFAVPAAWPATAVEMWPLDKIKPYDKNPRIHSPQQVAALANAMVEDGVTMPILIDEDGIIIAGHGRRLAAAKNKFREYPVVIARGWTDVQKRAARLKDNQLGLLSEWDDKLLQLEVGALKTDGYNLPLLGFGGEELLRLETLDADMGNRGDLLELVNIAIKDPTYIVAPNDHYVLSDRHHLICASVISDWNLWKPLLDDGALFCPYPGVFVPFSTKAATHPLVMVQPDPYICGHILDRYQEVHGKKAIVKKSGG